MILDEKLLLLLVKGDLGMRAAHGAIREANIRVRVASDESSGLIRERNAKSSCASPRLSSAMAVFVVLRARLAKLKSHFQNFKKNIPNDFELEIGGRRGKVLRQSTIANRTMAATRGFDPSKHTLQVNITRAA